MFLRLCANCLHSFAPAIARDNSNHLGDCSACTVRNSFYTYVHITDINL